MSRRSAGPMVLCAAVLAIPVSVPIPLSLAAPAVAAEPAPEAPTQLAAGIIVGLETTTSRAAVSTLRETVAAATGGTAFRLRMASADRAVVSFEQPRVATDAAALATAVSHRPDVAWAEPDLLLRREAGPALPDDARFDDQWALWDPPNSSDFGLQAPLGWTASRGNNDVIVAALDTGWTDHPDLADRVIDGYDFIKNATVANDGDGRDPDAHDPGDWVTSSEAQGFFQGCDPSNSSWHGTHVAGTIAARQDNRIGISGVAPDARVMMVRVLGKCFGSTSDITDAIVWAAGGHVSGVPDNPRPAQVISMSLGGTSSCGNAFRSAVSYARKQGVIVVVAAGNEGKPIASSEPANCPGVIPVVATDSEGKRPSWSNYGTSGLPAVIAAPGVDILSTYNDGQHGPGSPSYESASGTSMAAPHVAGVVALLRSMGVAPADVIGRLQKLVRAFPRSSSGRACDRTSCGPGLLNLSSLQADDPGPTPEPGPDPTVRPAIVGPVSVGYDPRGPVSTVTIRWRYTPPPGEPKATRFRYRLRIGSGDWTAWKEATSTTLRIESVPRGRLSLAEIAAVNAIGVGPAYQATIYPD